MFPSEAIQGRDSRREHANVYKESHYIIYHLLIFFLRFTRLLSIIKVFWELKESQHMYLSVQAPEIIYSKY